MSSLWNIDDFRKPQKREVKDKNTRRADRGARSVTNVDPYAKERMRRALMGIPKGAIRLTRAQARYLYGIPCESGREREIVWIKDDKVVYEGDD